MARCWWVYFNKRQQAYRTAEATAHAPSEMSDDFSYLQFGQHSSIKLTGISQSLRRRLIKKEVEGFSRDQTRRIWINRP